MFERTLAALGAACLLTGVPSPAQDAGRLAGSVRTSDGLAVPHLPLEVSGPGGSRFVSTGPDGQFRLTGLAFGAYDVGLAAPGFLPAKGRAEVGRAEARVDLVLRPAPLREQVVVTATRGEAPASTLGVSLTALDRERIGEHEASSFDDLLREVPGVSIARTGGIGHQSSSFLRGGESNFARVMIDGVPANEPGGFYNYAAQIPLELERVEVVRGAASALYGTDALAGVVQLVTRRAAAGERPGFTAQAEAGGSAWRRFQGGSSGRSGAFDWNAGVTRLDTDNDQPNSAFEQTAGVVTAGARLSERTNLRLLARGETSRAGTPGQLAFGRPDLDAVSGHGELVASGVVRQVRDGALHELRVGYARTDQLSRDPLDSGDYLPGFEGRVAAFPSADYTNPPGFQNDTQRLALGYQAERAAGARHWLTAGAELERETGQLGDRRDPLLLEPRRANLGVYLQDRVALAGRLFLSLGGRLERNDSYGMRAVPRAALALRLGPARRPTTLRASAGAGIKEPSFFQSFGVFDFARGNPDLRPERSRTFDLGVEQRLLGDRLRLEATGFHHDYRDQIAYEVLSFDPFVGSYRNLGRTRGQGLELQLEAAPSEGLRLAAQYTLLDGEVLASNSFDPVYAVGRPLLRRPRHQGSLWLKLGGRRASAGASLLLVGRRSDSDFLGIGLKENPGYARLDLRGRLALGGGLEAFAVAENSLDRAYQEVLGYPAPGRSLRLGLRFRSGAGSRP